MHPRLAVLGSAALLAVAQLPLAAAAQDRQTLLDASVWHLAAGASQWHFRLVYGGTDRVLAEARREATAPLREADSQPGPEALDHKAPRGGEGAMASDDSDAAGEKSGATLPRDGDRDGNGIARDLESPRPELKADSTSRSRRISLFDAGS